MALNGLFCADVPLRNYSLTPTVATVWRSIMHHWMTIDKATIYVSETRPSTKKRPPDRIPSEIARWTAHRRECNVALYLTIWLRIPWINSTAYPTWSTNISTGYTSSQKRHQKTLPNFDRS